MSFPFLQLPAEIRNHIYGHALIPEEKVVTFYVWARKVKRWRREDVYNSPNFEPVSTNLILANKQVQQEAQQILYSEVAFAFDTPRKFSMFMAQIGSCAVYLRKISLRDFQSRRHWDAIGAAANELIAARKLKGFRISSRQSFDDFDDHSAPASEVAKLFVKVAEPWIRARSTGTDVGAGSWEDIVSFDVVYGYQGRTVTVSQDDIIAEIKAIMALKATRFYPSNLLKTFL